ncbi:Uncharacterized protein Fot_34310 [Forsythia ovata]|uniref:Uncharacterized protein n=1 Tax=Forsythia ovata TaxID=205694 RepID=A0ABD1SIA4_9LAMI
MGLGSLQPLPTWDSALFSLSQHGTRLSSASPNMGLGSLAASPNVGLGSLSAPPILGLGYRAASPIMGLGFRAPSANMKATGIPRLTIHINEHSEPCGTVSKLRPTNLEEWRPFPLVRHPSKFECGHSLYTLEPDIRRFSSL